MDGIDCFPTLNEMLDSLPTLDKKLEALRVCPPQVIEHLVTSGIPQNCLLLQYLGSLSNEERTICYQTAMICWIVTGLTMIPWEMQFRVVLSDVQWQDCLIAAGTGSRKTLPITLSILLDDPAADSITITISPLKCLQVTQESDFRSRFQIPTVTINDDTDHSIEWWNVSKFILSWPCTNQLLCKRTSTMPAYTLLICFSFHHITYL